MTVASLDVPTENLHTIQTRIERINKKLATYEGEPFTLTITEAAPRIVRGGVTDMSHVDITGIPPSMNGWELVAEIEPSDGGNIIRKLSGKFDELPERYRTTDLSCEHCNASRRRNQVFIVYNGDKSEWKQVGSTCLCDFTGAGSAAHALYTVQSSSSLTLVTREAASECVPSRVSTLDFLAQVTRICRSAKRFISSKEAYKSASGVRSTARQAWECSMAFAGVDFSELMAPSDSDFRFATAALSHVNGWDNLESKAGALPDFQQALLVHSRNECLKDKDAATAAYIVSFYRDVLKRAKTAQYRR